MMSGTVPDPSVSRGNLFAVRRPGRARHARARGWGKTASGAGTVDEDAQPPESREDAIRPNLVSRRTFWQTGASNFLIGGVGAVTAALAARILGPAGRGDLAAIQIWPGFLCVVAMIGMPEAFAYFIARDRSRSREVVTTGLLLSLGAAGVLGGIGAVLVPAVLSSRSSVVADDAQWALLLIPFYCLASLPAAALRGVGHYRRWNVLRVSLICTWLAVLIGAFVAQHAFELHVTPGGLAAAYIAGVALIAIPITISVYRGLEGPSRPSREVSRRLLRFGLPAMGATFPLWLNLRLDQLAMASLVPAHQLGLYVAAVAWAQVVSPILNALGSVLLPRLAAERSRATKSALFVGASRLGVVLMIVVVIPALALTPVAVRLLFGRAFLGAVPSALLLVLGGCILGWNYILSEALLGCHRTRGPMYAQLVGLGATGVALGLLLGPLGILGAAVASVAGYGATTLWLLIEARRVTGQRIRDLVLPGREELRVVGHLLGGGKGK
jgi:O-antigen/teichoic acid export membrane protein